MRQGEELGIMISRRDLEAHYRAVRGASEALCKPLLAEDCCMQTMSDVSPPKWHLAHVSWFFETFLLQPLLPDYRLFHPRLPSCSIPIMKERAVIIHATSAAFFPGRRSMRYIVTAVMLTSI